MAELLFVLYLLSVIGGIVIVLGEERSAVSSIPWILVVIFIPVVGLLLYLIFGYSVRRKQLIDVEVRRALSDAPVETKSLPSTAVEKRADRKLTSLSALIERLTDTSLTTANELTLYDDSREWLVTCRDAIVQAQHYIYIELYRIEEGPWLDALLDLLAARIQEGVALYWLYDDVGSRSLSRRYRKRTLGATALASRGATSGDDSSAHQRTSSTTTGVQLCARLVRGDATTALATAELLYYDDS